MIQLLRMEEEVLLYGLALQTTEEEDGEVVEFLREAFQAEALGYPHDAPEFNPDAALWSAKIIYFASQFLLYRETSEHDLPMCFPAYPGEQTAGAILSADLCLRFLPDILAELQDIDPEDRLLVLLEELASNWLYSSIRWDIPLEKCELEPLLSDNCLKQLLIDRIIEFKKIKCAAQPEIYREIKAGLGLYTGQFWNELNLVMDDE